MWNKRVRANRPVLPNVTLMIDESGKPLFLKLLVGHLHRRSCRHDSMYEIDDRFRSFAEKGFCAEGFCRADESRVMQVPLRTNTDR